MVRAIVGANWGDEGKGKITDMFAEESDVVVRFQGGAMPAIPSSVTMGSSPCTNFRRVCFIPTSPISSEMALHWMCRNF